jgi:hypothetical protein
MEKICNIMTKQLVTCVAGPQFYGGPDLQRGGPATQSKQLAAQPRLWSKGFKTCVFTMLIKSLIITF